MNAFALGIKLFISAAKTKAGECLRRTEKRIAAEHKIMAEQAEWVEYYNDISEARASKDFERVKIIMEKRGGK